MLNIVLASNNKKKLQELETLLAADSSNNKRINVFSLKDIDCEGDVEETGTSFEENALLKALVPAQKGHIGVADDSGLSVDFLHGAPGIYSARYAGGHGDDVGNRKKLLKALDGVPSEKRSGKFICAIAVVLPESSPLTIPEPYRISAALGEKFKISPEKAAVVSGECCGIILAEEKGTQGFGYDSLFWYPEFGKTFAEIDGEIKNSVSHRGNAIKKLKLLLNELS